MLFLFELTVGFWKLQVLTYQSVLGQEKKSDLLKAEKHLPLKYPKLLE